MTTINRTSGLQIEVPSGYGVAQATAPASPRRGTRAGRGVVAVPMPQDPSAPPATRSPRHSPIKKCSWWTRLNSSPAPPLPRPPSGAAHKPAAVNNTTELGDHPGAARRRRGLARTGRNVFVAVRERGQDRSDPFGDAGWAGPPHATTPGARFRIELALLKGLQTSRPAKRGMPSGTSYGTRSKRSFSSSPPVSRSEVR